jgi:hypothetical protein
MRLRRRELARRGYETNVSWVDAPRPIKSVKNKISDMYPKLHNVTEADYISLHKKEAVAM